MDRIAERRDIAREILSGCIEADDRVADIEFGEELGHAVMLDLALDLNHLVAGKHRHAKRHAVAGFIERDLSSLRHEPG